MNRQIKFRDFCFDTNKMRYFDLDQYDRDEHDCFGNIMQFTGLVDKNGRQIYEGDIISMTSNRPVAVIEYDYCAFVFKWIDKHYISTRKPLEPLFRNIHLFEVVGNIHENPELL